MKLKKHEQTLRKQFRENQKIKGELKLREKAVQIQGRRFADSSNYEKQLSILAKAQTPQIRQESLNDLRNQIQEQQKHFEDEKRLMNDKVRYVEKERDELREALVEMEQ